ncbi:SDR family NAD(P)-dependent oxidoreductase [Gordonia soli]|uniref:Putative acyl-CoA reductase n=1 Tax=Gordonia soli NBRC 108243 TaxID=1223545 RepID=M0QFE6_9ACTN|nr:SDR family NAD(P)-dependent oxidoreductase [Gordonia soli]GAC67293.1 putative acyl-CoA reductase [Gordonia soli NBRC 108243]
MTLSELPPSEADRALHPDILSRLTLATVGPPMDRDADRLAAAVGGKVVVITGASFGQGEATARLLASAGATVVLAARTRERLDEIVDEIRTAGGTAHSYRLDLGDMAAVDFFADRVLTDHGRVDILIHNAGKSLRRSVYRSAERMRDMEAMVGVNFLGPMRLTLALLPAMRAAGGGHIINVATAGLWMSPAAPRWGFYLGCKAGFDTWIRSVGMETSADGIDVTSVYAGHIKSRMVATKWVTRVPGHTPAEAAHVLAHAITHRPRALAPRGMAAVRLLGIAFEAPLTIALTLLDRRGVETPASNTAFLRAMAATSAAPGDR